jgi:PAS domain S-box-containing protein
MNSENIFREMGELEFRELADNAPVMIWRSRPDKQCDWFNKPWIDYSGRSQEELFGYGWAEDVHPEDFERCVTIYQTAFDAREKFTMPYRLRRHDGVYRWFLDNGAPFYRHGEFAGYFGSCIDITEHRELEEHQRTLLAELNHRVRNNLQLIMSFLQLSKLRAKTDEAKTLLQGAMARVKGVGIIQDELHRSASGAVELGEYLSGLARAVLRSESTTDLELIVNTAFIRVPHDLAANLGMVVNELITNSIKHAGPENNAISLTVESTGDTVKVVIADRGRGFPVVAENTISGMQGSGLVDALVKRSGGSISRSNDGGAHVSVVVKLAHS